MRHSFGPARGFLFVCFGFITILSVQEFYNESTVEKNKAKITPEINLLGNHIFLTKNHDAFSSTPYQRTPDLEVTALRMDLYFLICITDCLHEVWHIKGI